MPRAQLRLLPPLLLLALLSAGLTVTAPPPLAAQATNPQETAPLIKRAQQRMLMQKARAKFVRMAEKAEALRQQALEDSIRGKEAHTDSGATVAPKRTHRRKPAADWREPEGAQGTQGAMRVSRSAQPAASNGFFVPPPNVRANDPTGDAFNSGQCEQDIAAHSNNILVAWNDGQGYADFTNDSQGYAYSTDGGATFTDGGKLPKPAGFPSFIWTSDPLVSINEATGEFYYLGLCSPTSTTNGIAIVRGTFGGGTINWTNPVIIRTVNNTEFFLDKPWMVADSSNGSVYVTYTEFDPFGDEINLHRSTDGGTVWSAKSVLSAPIDDGYVQGSRPVVGPNGELYVFWYTIGGIDVDWMSMRLSTNGGSTFGTEVMAATFYANFGTGAPGFNRDMGIQFPSVAVDRVPGSTNRGRVYLTWNESVNWFDDPLGGGGNKNEVETNDAFAQATPFTPGQRLRGSLINLDTDYFSFTANQGQTYIFWADSVEAVGASEELDYTMRIYCSDQVTRLSLSGALSLPGSQGWIVWTAPATGTYYLRMASLDNSENGGYRIQTGINGGTPTRGRDHRDVFVSASSNMGSSWTTPSRVNAEVGWYDNWLPEVEVGLADGQGRPYVIWYDWRDAASSCAGMSHVYLARSDNAGGSWSELGALTSAQTDWTNVQSNISPNQGDYLALYSDMTNLYAAWADGRNANPDVYVSVVPLASTPVLISLATATAEFDRVKLSWFSGGDPLASADVQRRTANSEWQTMATVSPDGSDLLHFEDTNVRAGENYGYRLRILDGVVERFVGETWVQVPDAMTLAISIHPNPTNADAFIAFSLPTDAAASLTVHDVAGRLVRSIDVGVLGAGHHTVNVGAQGRLQAGVYIVRLTQGGRSITSRLSVVR